LLSPELAIKTGAKNMNKETAKKTEEERKKRLSDKEQNLPLFSCPQQKTVSEQSNRRSNPNPNPNPNPENRAPPVSRRCT
jgi:hypothetical protein